MVITRCSVTQMISSRLQQPARNHQHSLEHLSVDSPMLPSQRSPDQGAHRLQVASCSSTWPRESKRPDGSRFKNLCARACVVSTVLMKQPMPLRSTTPSSTSKRFVGVEKEPSSTRRRRWYWHWDPRFVSERNEAEEQSSSIVRTELSDAATLIDIPTMLVRGRMSDIVSDESVSELKKLVPQWRSLT